MHAARGLTVVAVMGLALSAIGSVPAAEPAAADSHEACIGCGSTNAPVEIDGDQLRGTLAQYEILNNGGGSGSEPPSCDWYESGSAGLSVEQRPREGEELRTDGQLVWRLYESRSAEVEEGSYYFYYCWHPDMDNERGQQRLPPNIEGNCGEMSETLTVYVCYFDAIDPESLATLAVDQFVDDLGRPVPRFNPEGTTVVNFDTWLWVEGDIPGDGEQEFERLEVPGQWVETTGRVSGVQWDMGDGEGVKDCPVTKSPEEAEAECAYRYARSSAGEDGDAFRGSASVVWEVTYTGQVGGEQIGDTFDVRIEEPFDIQVAESQAVVVR